MTWTRVKRWIGTHPALVLAAVNGGGGFLSSGAADALMGPLSTIPSWPVSYLPLKLACLVAAVAVTCYVGCLRGRAGLPTWPVRYRALLLVLPLYGLLLAVSAISWGPLESMKWLTGVSFGPWPFLVAATSLAAGLRLAEEITRRQLAKGKWEHTEPVERPKEHS